MRSPDGKNNKKQVLKFLFISFILIFPTFSNNIQNSNPVFNEDSYQEVIRDKIDSQLLQLINSKEESQSLPVIILYNYDDEGFKEELDEFSDKVIYNYKLIPATSMSLSSDKIHSIAKLPSVKRIYLDKKVYPLSFEKEKRYGEFSGSSPYKIPYTPLINQSVPQIGAPYLWDLGLNGSGVVVAVLDTGIDKTHLDLNDLDDNPSTDDPKVINETSFIDFNFDGIIDEDTSDYVGHGTHVAGIISGTGEASSYRFRGVAPGSKLMNVKVLTTYGGYTSWIIKGIEYAVFGDDNDPNNGNEADIISMSLGGSGFIDDPIIQAVDAAWDLNKTVVIAAGNSRDDFFTLESPGLSAKAITVGAIDQNDDIADFSSRGPTPDLRMGVDLCAPGVEIVSALANQSIRQQTNQNYTSKSGTSMATPFVAGAIAILLQSDPKLMPTILKTALMASAVDLGVSSYIQGAGKIDVYAAYNLINNNYASSSKDLIRVNRLDMLEIYNQGLLARINPRFYFDFFGDWHRNNSYSAIAYEDIWEMFFAIRYNTSEEQKFYTSYDLIEDYPREMRWLVFNTSHKIAIESLKTPDGIFKIDIIYESYNDSKWIRVSFNLTSLDDSDVLNTKFYYYMDPEIYGPMKMEDEEDYSDDGVFIKSINALVANDTYYDEETHPKFGFYPNNFLGFASMNQSIAFEVNDWYVAYSNLIDDTLSNNTYYHGDVILIQEWLNSTFSPNSNAYLPIILSFGNNKSNFIDNVNEAKNTPFFKLDKSDITIDTLTVPNPIYNATESSFNISITNIGFSASSKCNVTTFVDDVEINKTEVNGLLPGEVVKITIPIIFNSTGIHNIKVLADHLKDEFEYAYSNNMLQRDIKVITTSLITFFPHSPIDNPLTLKYGGQFLFWNCTILQGESFTDLKINKTGNGKSYVSFDNNPSSLDEITIEEGIGQYNLNISINIPEGTSGLYHFDLQILNSSSILYEIPIEFEIIEDLPIQLVITNKTVDDDGLEDEDGIIEGEEDGSIEFFVNTTDGYSYVSDIFMIVSSKSDSTVGILDYNIYIDYRLYSDDSTWSDDDFDFTVPYNHTGSVVKFEGIFFAKIENSDDFTPFFHNTFNCSIQQRTPGIPNLELDSIEYLDLDLFNYNGIVEPGETGVFGINFKNLGDGSALQIFSTNFTCSDSRVTIPKPFYIWFIFIIPTIHIQWNGIDPGDITESYSGFPVFILPSSIPRGTTLLFELEIEYCNITGDLFKETFQFSYTIPLISDGGNGDDDDGGKGENALDDILLVISVSSIGAIVAVVSIILIKKRKSNLLRIEKV